MEISISEHENSAVLKFNKNKLLGTEGVEFQNSLLNLLDEGKNSLIVDLSSVDFVTSWAIGMLVHGFTTSTNRNAKFSLYGVNGKVHETLAKVKLDTIFDFKNSI